VLVRELRGIHRWLLEPIGQISSAEAEGRYYAQACELANAVRLTPNGFRRARRFTFMYLVVQATASLHAEDQARAKAHSFRIEA
jgi:hypothetical protein